MSLEQPEAPRLDPLDGRRARRVLGFMLLAGLALRLVDIDKSLYYDEMWATDLYIGEPFLLLRTLYRDVSPPFHRLFMFGWIQVFGDSAISIRIPSILCGLGTAGLVYRLGFVFRDRTTGLVAAALMCFAPNAIWWSMAARNYSMGIFFAALTAVAFHRSTSGRARGVVLYGAALFGLLMSHYYAVAFLPVLLLGSWVLAGDRRRRRTLLVTTIALGALPFAMIGMRMIMGSFVTAKDYLRAFEPGEFRLLFLWWYPLGPNPSTSWSAALGFDPRWAVGGALALLLGVGIVSSGIMRDRDRPAGWWLSAWTLATPALLFTLGFIGKDQYYVERSALLAMPFYFTLLALGVTAIRTLRKPTIAIGGIALLAAAAHFLGLDPVDADGRPLPDSRALAAYLEDESREDFDRRTVITDIPLTIAHATPLAEEARLLQSDSRELESARALIESKLGEGSLAEAAERRISSAFRDLEAWKTRRRAGLRFSVIYAGSGNLRGQIIRHAREHGVVYLVTRDPSPMRTESALETPALAVETIPGFQAIIVRRITLAR